MMRPSRRSIHRRQAGLRQQEGRPHLHIEVSLQVGPRHIREGLGADGRRGVVDQDVDGAERLGRLPRQRLGAVRAREIGPDRHGASLALPLDRGDDALGAIGAAVVGDHHVHAVQRQPLADRSADAAATAGDQHHPAAIEIGRESLRRAALEHLHLADAA